MPATRYPRPGILNLITFVSLIWSVAGVIWFLLVLLAALGISVLSWLGGPIAGAVGTMVGLGIVVVSGLKSLLSLVLFVAAVKTWSGEPEGRSLHKLWAWITLVLDALDLLLTAGLDPGAWWGLVYAGLLIYLLDQPDMVAYFEGRLPDGRGKPMAIDADGF